MNTDTIIPGKSIGQFQINWTSKELFSHFINNYEIRKLTNEKKIYYNNFHFWINKNDKVVQISVVSDFDGKFMDKIGLGSTLKDIEQHFGKWEEDLDVYVIPQYKGICFEVKDIDNMDEEWIEDQMPINVISVFDPKEDLGE